jgi:hypothetical protein
LVTERHRLVGLSLPVDAPQAALIEAFERRTGLPMAELAEFQMVKRSLDARREGGVPQLAFVYQIEFGLRQSTPSATLARLQRSGQLLAARAVPPLRLPQLAPDIAGSRERIAVLGAGPAGLFAAWMLAAQGLSVVVLDRGSRIEQRGRELVRFHRTRHPGRIDQFPSAESGRIRHRRRWCRRPRGLRARRRRRRRSARSRRHCHAACRRGWSRPGSR